MRGLSGRFDVHSLYGPVSILPHLPFTEAEAAHQIASQVGDDGVFPDVADAEDACGAALLRQQGKAVFDGLLGCPVSDSLSMQADAPAGLRHCAEEVLQHLRAPGAIQSGDAQHLAPAKLEAGVLQTGIPACEMLYLQNHLAGYIVLRRETVGQLATHHQLDDFLYGQVGGAARGHPFTVPHDGHFIADAEYLIHFVADIDDAAALLPEHVDDTEQMLHLRLRQRGGGLVEHDDLGVVADRLGDLHHLPLGDRQRGHDGFGIDADVQLVEDLPCTSSHDALADHDARHLRVAAQPQVVHHAAGESLVQLLMHHCHAAFQRFL